MNGFVIAGRTALVTGGGKGIGAAIVRLLIEKGATRVLIVGRDTQSLEAAERAGGGRIIPAACDLADRRAVAALAETVAEVAPHLSLVVNNAGSQRLTDLMGADAPSLAIPLCDEIEANFTAPVALTCRLLPVLSAQASAMIVNVTSGLALAPKQSSPVYCATKAAMRSFTKALRYQAEARAPHIQVVEALPPLVETGMTTGRGRGKISAEACAAQIVAGIEVGRSEIFVGKAKLLRAIFGISPTLAERIMRNG